jgi:hypothetical protein
VVFLAGGQGLYNIWVRVNGCPENLCRDYLALFAVGSLVGKATEVDMNFTQEDGVVRMKIDYTNPHDITRHVSHFYDGEGFTVYFDVETPDGSIVPAGEFENEDGNEDGKGKHADPKNDPTTPQGNQNSIDDPMLPKSSNDQLEGSK